MNAALHDDALSGRERAVLAIALAVLLLLPVGRTAELPWLIGALAGIVVLFTTLREYAIALAVLGLALIGRAAELPWLLAAPIVSALLFVAALERAPATALRVLALLFAAYWLPALLSAFDAVAPLKTWSTVAVALRFLPFALLLLVVVRGRAPWLRAFNAIAGWIVIAWTLDALVQAATGWSIAGHLGGDRVSGVFGDDNLKLGPVLAVLSPFALNMLLERHGRGAFALGWLLFAAAILLAGARAGWICYAVVTLAMLWRVTGGARRFMLSLLGAMVAAALLGVVAYNASERFAARVDRTTAVFRGDAAALDFALAGRVPIFATATRMARAHPINGVGVRGFRYAYADYAAPDDPWIDPRSGTGALHPHQIVLEVAAETGLPGLLAWLVAALCAWRAWRRQSPAARALGYPAALALCAMTFPLNTHFAFYSSFWALLLWWLLAVWLAAWRDDEGLPR